MEYMFSVKGMIELRSFVDSTTLFAFDLDGTLAPIVSEPSGIAIPEDVRQSLMQLNGLAPVAVITGRSRADALTHLGFTPRFLVGNHGAEGLPGAAATAQDFARLCQEWKTQLIWMLPDMASLGIVLEEKGQTLALHYRKAADQVAAQEELLAAIDRLHPVPRVVSGIFVKNLAPANAPHKGTALEALLVHLRCQRAIFVGDDVTDEDVFSLHNPAILGIRVDSSDNSAALFYLQGQHELIRLLQEMIGILTRD
ncbi:MAG: trehalose-phosphatase [Desulfuromonadaceae bacterium]|nr:trehalose-phosphatase [Desulfuromonadaceae bacterium]